MKVTGRCYCGDIHFEAEGDVGARLQCHCRECQFLTGGGPNVTMAMPKAGFRITQGATTAFTRTDFENPVTREFCARCGTQVFTRSPRMPEHVMLKVGTFDDPAMFEQPSAAIYLSEAQPFHAVPPGVPTYEKRIPKPA